MMEPDELEDIQEQADIVGYLTPREYARLRSMHPQQVYAYIRKGIIETEHCRCGRRVVNVEEADKALSPEEKARRRELAARDARSAFD